MPPSDSHQDDEEDDSCLRILLATDIHLGYKEKDPHRSGDSFAAFEEILQVARRRQVDLLLLGGDLFHENKPTRDAEKRCLDLLQRYVLGDGAIQIEFLSDPEVNFAHCQRRELNYMNPNMNIGLPVFSVHGNHDDPSGLGGHSCMDLLHSSGLINYFGRIDNLEDVTVTPLLLRKGDTKFALYGMSAMKDERLHRLFRSGKVRMLRPEEDTEDWFNLLVLHQNRAKHGPTNYIPDYFIEDFFDLVFWGHEHECRLEPEVVSKGDKRFFITQPGSSVATSLSEGESVQKKVGLLTVSGKDFKIEPIPLQTVRPMVFKTMSIDNAPASSGIYSGNEQAVRTKVEKYLKDAVEDMLEEAQGKLTGHPDQPTLPLLRLRVEYSDEAHMLAPGRFGNNFYDRVANPSDILLFRRKVLDKTKADESDFAAEHMDNLRLIHAQSSMEDLIQQYFNTTKDEKSQLKLLGVKGIVEAVSSYIEKDNKEAISLIVDKQLDKTRKTLRGRQDDLEEGGDGGDLMVPDDEDAIDEALSEYRRQRAGANEAAEARELLEGQGAMGGRQRRVQQEQDDDFGDDFAANGIPDEDDLPPPRGRGRGASSASSSASTRGRGGRGRGRAAASAASSSIVSAFSRQSQRQQQEQPAASNGNSSRRSPRRAAAARSSRQYISDSDGSD